MLDQFREALGHVRTNGFSKVCILVVIVNSLIDSCPHNCFNPFDCSHYRVWKQKNCTVWCKLNSVHLLQTHLPVILVVIVFILMRFRLFLTIHTNMICTCVSVCMHFCFDPLSRAFSNWCIFNENTQHISVDRRPKRISVDRGLSAPYVYIYYTFLFWLCS